MQQRIGKNNSFLKCLCWNAFGKGATRETLFAVPQKESFLAALLEKYSMQQNPSQRVLALWEHLVA